MSDFTIEQLEAMREGITPGMWAATNPPYSDDNPPEIFEIDTATLIFKASPDTDHPGDADKNLQALATVPELIDQLIAEKQAHQALRAEVEELRDWYIARSQRMQSIYAETFDSRFADYAESYEATADMLNDILEADHG